MFSSPAGLFAEEPVNCVGREVGKISDCGYPVRLGTHRSFWKGHHLAVVVVQNRLENK